MQHVRVVCAFGANCMMIRTDCSQFTLLWRAMLDRHYSYAVVQRTRMCQTSRLDRTNNRSSLVRRTQAAPAEPRSSPNLILGETFDCV